MTLITERTGKAHCERYRISASAAERIKSLFPAAGAKRHTSGPTGSFYDLTLRAIWTTALVVFNALLEHLCPNNIIIRTTSGYMKTSDANLRAYLPQRPAGSALPVCPSAKLLSLVL